jgi:four helix bundle protein
MIKNFRELDVWNKADELAHRVFDLTETFPRQYLFDLTSQLRRAALSVPTNIAEGCATPHTKELLQFINIARRSASETQYLVLFAARRNLLTRACYEDLTSGYEAVHRMLNALSTSLRQPRLSERPSQVGIALALLAFWVIFTSHWSLVTGHCPLVFAQSSNGTTTLVKDGYAAGGGTIGGGNPMRIFTVVGEPSGGAMANATSSLRGGYQVGGGNLPVGSRLISVTGSVNEPVSSVIVGGLPAVVTGTGYRADSIQLVEGSNTISIEATDLAGNRATKTINVILDTRPPARPTHAATPPVTSGSTYTLTGTKTKGTSLWVNGTQIVPLGDETTWSAAVTLSEGDNDFVIVAKDAAGNVSTSAVATTVVDNLPPVIAASPPAKTNLTPFALTGTVDDHLTTVAVNGQSASRSGRSFTADVSLIEGANTITITATSPNGYGSSKTLTIILGTIPAITSTAPSDGAKSYLGTTTTVQVTATDKEVDPIEYQMWLNGALLRDWAAGNATSWTPTSEQAGVHTLELRARDAFGGFASRQARVLVLRKPVEHP